jgi:hypothetical protein
MDELIKLAKKRYAEQEYRAKQRKIDWLFTFESWWQMWQDSGKWAERGRKLGQYCMARKGDIGPYSPDNVEIILIEQNLSDAHANGRCKYGTWSPSEEQIEAMRQRKLGVKQSEESKQKISNTLKGKSWSEARRKHFEEHGNWNQGKAGYKTNYPNERKSKIPVTDETKKNISEALKGRKLSPEHVEKLRNREVKPTGRKLPMIICKYCGHENNSLVIARFHNEKCKQKNLMNVNTEMLVPDMAK